MAIPLRHAPPQFLEPQWSMPSHIKSKNICHAHIEPSRLQICGLPGHKGPYFTVKHHQKILALSLKFTKTVGGYGFGPDPTTGAYDAPHTP